MKKNIVKRIVWLSILVTIAASLAIIDKFISSILMPLIPVIGVYLSNLKIGLANLVILYLIDHFSFKYSLIGVLLKSVIVGLIYGSFISFYIGFTGSILSYLVMVFLNKSLKFNHKYIFISMIGGFSHMVGQLSIVILIYGITTTDFNFLIYSPFILIIGIITGLIIGLIYTGIDKLIPERIKSFK